MQNERMNKCDVPPPHISLASSPTRQNFLAIQVNKLVRGIKYCAHQNYRRSRKGRNCLGVVFSCPCLNSRDDTYRYENRDINLDHAFANVTQSEFRNWSSKKLVVLIVKRRRKKRDERGIGDNHWSHLSLHFLTIVRRSSGRLPSVFRCHCIVSIEFSWLLYVHNISASLSPIRRPSFLLFSCSIVVTHTKPRLYIFALRSWPRYKAALCLLLITFTNSRVSIRARGCSVGKIDSLRHSAHHRFGTDRLRV